MPNEYTLHLKGRKVVWPATGPKQQHQQQQQQQQLQQQQQSGKTFQVCALSIFSVTRRSRSDVRHLLTHLLTKRYH